MGNANSGRLPGVVVRSVSPVLKSLGALAEMRGIAIPEVAAALGVSSTAIYEYLSGRHAPSLIRAEEMAQVLGAEIRVVPLAPGELAKSLTTAQLLDALGYTIELRRKA